MSPQGPQPYQHVRTPALSSRCHAPTSRTTTFLSFFFNSVLTQLFCAMLAFRLCSPPLALFPSVAYLLSLLRCLLSFLLLCICLASYLLPAQPSYCWCLVNNSTCYVCAPWQRCVALYVPWPSPYLACLFIGSSL